MGAQDLQVSGTVTDAENGDPLPGVSILVEGTTTGTVTNIDGDYELSAPSDGTLIFSYIGFETAEIAIDGRSDIDVALQQGVLRGEEVVVTGYQTQSRRDITGAVSSVDIEDIIELPASSLGDQLQGRLPGVTIQTGGSPGANARIRVRGISTIGNNEPLIILDGVPTEASLNEINPNEIESIQVLKDAASASIYGARAASGVIVISTKTGAETLQPEVSVEYYSGIQQPTNLPDMLNPQELADVMWQAQRNAGIDPGDPQLGTGDVPVIPDYILPEGAFEGDVDESTYHWVDNQIVRANKEGTDWFDQMFDPAMMHNLSLSARGSSSGSSYLVSGNFLTQNGIVNYTGFDRLTARANTRVAIADILTVGENLSVSFTNQKGTNARLNATARSMPFLPVYDIQGNWAGSEPAGLGPAENPYAAMYLGRKDRDQTFRTFGNAFAEVAAIENVVLRSSIGIDYATGRETEWNPFDHWNSEHENFNSFEEGTYTHLNWTWTNTLNYQTILNDIHDVEVLLGTETISARRRTLDAERNNYFSDSIDYRYIGTGTLGIQNNGGGYTWGLNSLFAKADYIYDDRYLLSATLRRDGSSRFGSNNRYGLFPAVSLGWRLTSESFLQGSNLFSNLLLRGSWGQTGNQEIGNYPAYSTYAAGLNPDSYDLSGSNNSVSTGFDLKVLGNEDIRWETTTQTNLGLDADFMNGALSFVVDLYRKNTTDMLLQVPQPAQLGEAEFPYVNIGSVRNQGIEVAADYFGMVGELSYGFGVNVAHYDNEITELVGEQSFLADGPARTYVGQPISMYYGYVIDGTFQTEAEVAAHAEQPQKAVGRWIFRDVDGNGVVNSDDQTFIGNPHPDLTYGISPRLGYKGFELSMFVQGSIGNDLWHQIKGNTDFFNFIGNRSARILDSWTPENRDAPLPELNALNPNEEANKNSSYFVEDGSYLRIQSLQLGYTLPEKFVPGFAGVRVYLAARNVMTITNYGGVDPEVGGSDLLLGYDSSHYPLAKTYTFGVDVTL